MKLSISCTTRSPRPAEIDGRDYFFLTQAEFEAQREEGAFLEWAKVHDHLYGTRRADVEAVLKAGNDALLEIDWQGARQVAEKLPQAVRIFILPPSPDALRQRLIGRGQDSLEVVERRVAAAELEMSHADEAHHKIVNSDFDRALDELQQICR